LLQQDQEVQATVESDQHPDQEAEEVEVEPVEEEVIHKAPCNTTNYLGKIFEHKTLSNQ